MSDGQEAVTGRRCRVLVVDDNRDAADSWGPLLEAWGFDYRVAYDGASGLEAARAYLPDCLLLDVTMPRLNGYDVARSVRGEPALARAKLIALSAYSHEAHVRRVKEAGFDFCLVKPADPGQVERILRMLEEVVRLASKTEELARQNVELATETKELLQEVKEDVREVKEEVKELKEELREIKQGDAEAGA